MHVAVEAQPNASVQLVNADELNELLDVQDDFGRPICSLVMFYTPFCVFSRRVASYTYVLAAEFPQMRFFAVNVEQKTANTENMIAQFGIAATPTILLFENRDLK